MRNRALNKDEIIKIICASNAEINNVLINNSDELVVVFPNVNHGRAMSTPSLVVITLYVSLTRLSQKTSF